LIVHRILKDVLRESPEKMEGEVPVGVSSLGNDADRSLIAHASAKNAAAGISRTNRPQSGRQDAGATPPPSPWSKRRDRHAHQEALEPLGGPIPLEELHSIADESSQSERRADEAERGLMEWKKVKFMESRVGEDFDGLIISVTKYGFFVELTDLFVEGLVPLNTLIDDRYNYHEDTREIIGQRSRKTYGLGDRIRVLVDRIDPVEMKIQFAVFEEQPIRPQKKKRK
jgi:ribonuclease R